MSEGSLNLEHLRALVVQISHICTKVGNRKEQKTG